VTLFIGSDINWPSSIPPNKVLPSCLPFAD
jgi:hypothetical protein